jgi:CDP-glycerol glycerophosphotransferase (TagB/SpsB family)
MKEAYDEFQLKGYNVIKTYDENANSWLDIKKEIKPDVIFFLNPLEVTKKEYYILNYPEYLTCYVPYGYMLSNTEQAQFNKNFHNLTWKNFYETEIHKKMAEQFAGNKAVNVVVSGAPMCDKLLEINHKPIDPWKLQDKNIKRIIWAPHHTIEDNSEKFGYSNFLKYAEIFPDLLNKYHEKIQIAFKPHPLLKPKLYKNRDWGVERTDEYFKRWEDLPNGQLVTGAYEDLFLTSDALILDSISFLAEYMFTGKPCLFMVKDESVNNKFNEFGRRIYELVYKSHDFSELCFFIDDIVINGNDKAVSQRKLFKENVLNPPNHKTASQNIFDVLEDQFN